MDIIQRRKALADALTAHDAKSVGAFFHPSFVMRGTDGIVIMNYVELLSRLPAFFSRHPEYKQSVTIEASKIEGDSATITTKRSEVLSGLWRVHTACSCWNETWKLLHGEWVLAEETPKPA